MTSSIRRDPPQRVALCHDPAHITDVTITADLDGASGMINRTVDAEAADDLETKVILRDAEGTEVTTSTGPCGTLSVPSVHKWAPGEGYLCAASATPAPR
jgi:beta-glucuronidase